MKRDLYNRQKHTPTKLSELEDHFIALLSGTNYIKLWYQAFGNGGQAWGDMLGDELGNELTNEVEATCLGISNSIKHIIDVIRDMQTYYENLEEEGEDNGDE